MTVIVKRIRATRARGTHSNDIDPAELYTPTIAIELAAMARLEVNCDLQRLHRKMVTKIK